MFRRLLNGVTCRQPKLVSFGAGEKMKETRGKKTKMKKSRGRYYWQVEAGGSRRRPLPSCKPSRPCRYLDYAIPRVPGAYESQTPPCGEPPPLPPCPLPLQPLSNTTSWKNERKEDNGPHWSEMEWKGMRMGEKRADDVRAERSYTFPPLVLSIQLNSRKNRSDSIFLGGGFHRGGVS